MSFVRYCTCIHVFPCRVQVSSSPMWWCLAEGRLGKMWFLLTLQLTNLFHFMAVLHKFWNLLRQLGVSTGHSQGLISMTCIIFTIKIIICSFVQVQHLVVYAIARQNSTYIMKTIYEHLFTSKVLMSMSLRKWKIHFKCIVSIYVWNIVFAPKGYCRTIDGFCL